jgi:hypothetical protein
VSQKVQIHPTVYFAHTDRIIYVAHGTKFPLPRRSERPQISAAMAPRLAWSFRAAHSVRGDRVSLQTGRYL